jgi:hypothetical protein
MFYGTKFINVSAIYQHTLAFKTTKSFLDDPVLVGVIHTVT